MKWIGQHIVDFIARFRSDVYMENISEGTVDGDLFLGLDSNGKIVKEDVRAVSGVGDITGVTITTDSGGGGSVASDTGGSADFSILGTVGVGVTNSGAIITATAVPGEIDHDSLQNFLAAEHVDWAGASAGTIHASNYTDTTTNTQNTTVLSFVDSSNDILLRNTTGGAGSGTDDIKFVAGGNITLTHTDADNITIAATDGSTDVTLAGSLNYITISGQEITRNAIDLAADVTGVLPHANIGDDAIDGDNIADDVINSEHYVAASIDNEHLADNAVDTDEIADDAVTYAKIQDVSATNKILGRDSAGAGVIEEITPANLRTMINVEDGADVTDTANVTSAGALMDSEVTNLAFVKGLTAGISDGNVLTANDAVADDDFLRINGTEVEGLSAAEVKTALSLNNVENTALSTGNAATATTLATARAFQTNLASTSSANFDGSAANTHGVTGTLALGNGGTGVTSLTALKNVLDDETWSFANATTFSSGFTLGSDTITGIDTEDGFTDNDSTIMTSACIHDRYALNTALHNAVTINSNVADVLTLSTQAISATDPGNADILAGWDHSANKFTYLSAADSRTALGLGTSAVLDTAVIANGGAGVATADQIHTFVTTQTDATDADTAGNAATATLAADATTLATPRAINGVDFDGSAAITVTAAGSTLSDTVTVAKGGTGATSLTTDGVLFGNGTSAVSAVDLSSNGNIVVGGSTPAAVTGANLAGSGLAATVGNGTLVLAVETLNQDTTGSAATLTTPRAINGVDFDGSAPITVTAAGSTLSDTVTVAKGGTGLTTVGANLILTGNGANALTAEANLAFVGNSLAIGTNADIQPQLYLVNDLNSAEIGIANAADDFVDGSADGDLVINSVGDHNVIIAQNDTAALTIDTNGASSLSRKYSLPSTTVGDHSGGDIYYYGNGSTVKGGVYYINGTNWTLADADAEASTSGLLAVALGTDPDVHGMLLRGFVTLLTEIEGTEAIGSPIYLSATNSGKATITVPGSGDFVRVLGYSLHATGNQVYFNPDNTWVEVA